MDAELAAVEKKMTDHSNWGIKRQLSCLVLRSRWPILMIGLRESPGTCVQRTPAKKSQCGVPYIRILQKDRVVNLRTVRGKQKASDTTLYTTRNTQQPNARGLRLRSFGIVGYFPEDLLYSI